MKLDPGSHPRKSERGRSRHLRLTLLFFTVLAALLLVPAAQAFAETGHIKMNIVGTGSGEVRSEEEAGFGIGRGVPPIECSYNGSTSTQSGECENTPALLGEPGIYAAWLEAFPAAGSEFVGWTVDKGEDIGECAPASVSAPACLVSNVFGEENVGVEWEITAEFALSLPLAFKLNVTKAGTGSGTVTGGSTAKPNTINCGTGAGCEHEYVEGEEVTLEQTATAGSEFEGWTGCTSEVAGKCKVTMSAAKSVTATFKPAVTPPTEFKLNVTKAGTGSGTVTGGSTAKPNTINCGTGAGCEHEYVEGEEVTLEQTATAGSEFEGWTGCTSEVAGKCKVTMSAAKSVTATFKPGASGGSIVIGTATALECPTGGITVEVEGQPLTKQHICNGAAGAPGAPGSPGSPGTPGAPGATGPAGPAGPVGIGEKGFPGEPGGPGAPGAVGATGATGSQGAQGAQGVQGLQGPAGKVTVSCKVTNTKKVTCTVKNAKAAASSLSWIIRREGHAQSHGRTSLLRLNRVLAQLRPGRYELRVDGRTAAVVVPAAGVTE